jgi:hypothetical protein
VYISGRAGRGKKYVAEEGRRREDSLPLPPPLKGTRADEFSSMSSFSRSVLVAAAAASQK